MEGELLNQDKKSVSLSDRRNESHPSFCRFLYALPTRSSSLSQDPRQAFFSRFSDARLPTVRIDALSCDQECWLREVAAMADLSLFHWCLHFRLSAG